MCVLKNEHKKKSRQEELEKQPLGKTKLLLKLQLLECKCLPITVLTNQEVRAALVQMAQSITAQEHAITAQATREGSPRKNPHASTMARRMKDFTRMNPSVYFGSKTNEDTQEFVDEVSKILCAISVNEEEKAELTV